MRQPHEIDQMSRTSETHSMQVLSAGHLESCFFRVCFIVCLTNLSPQYFYFGHEQAKPRWEMTSIFLVTSFGPCAAHSSDSDGISSQWPVWVDERDNILQNSQDILRHCWFGAYERMNRGGIVYAQPVHHSKGTLLMPWNWFAHCHNTITYITLHTIYRK